MKIRKFFAGVSLLPMLCVVLAGQAQAQDARNAQQRLQAMGIVPSAERLVQYAAQGDANVVKLLLQAGASASAAEPLRRVTALHNAAAQGHIAVMKILLEQGVELDALDWRGTTPLISAAYFGQLEAVKLLLQRGAKVNAGESLDGVLTSAVYSGNSDVLELLLGQEVGSAEQQRALRVAQRAGRITMAASIQRRIAQQAFVSQ